MCSLIWVRSTSVLRGRRCVRRRGRRAARARGRGAPRRDAPRLSSGSEPSCSPPARPRRYWRTIAPHAGVPVHAQRRAPHDAVDVRAQQHDRHLDQERLEGGPPCDAVGARRVPAREVPGPDDRGAAVLRDGALAVELEHELQQLRVAGADEAERPVGADDASALHVEDPDRPHAVVLEARRRTVAARLAHRDRLEDLRGHLGPEVEPLGRRHFGGVDDDGHRADANARRCAGARARCPDLPGDRIPLGSSASLMRSLKRR